MICWHICSASTSFPALYAEIARLSDCDRVSVSLAIRTMPWRFALKCQSAIIRKLSYRFRQGGQSAGWASEPATQYRPPNGFQKCRQRIQKMEKCLAACFSNCCSGSSAFRLSTITASMSLAGQLKIAAPRDWRTWSAGWSRTKARGASTWRSLKLIDAQKVGPPNDEQ